MRLLSLLSAGALALLANSRGVFASEIREFDLKTVAQLGREMNRVSQRADKGASDAIRRRAQQTAIAALKGRLFKTHYDFLVVNDPDGSGFLVYAMPASSPSNIVLGGNFRVTVSVDGTKGERIDAMANTILPMSKPPKGMEGAKPVWVTMSQIVSNRPLETCVYTSLHDKILVGVGMVNDKADKMWLFKGDEIYEITPEVLRSLGIEDKKKKK
jgi:hypothetical protein